MAKRKTQTEDDMPRPRTAWPRDFIVTPPAYGCRHPLLGEFSAGDGPRKVTLRSQDQVDVITRRDCPFTIQPADESNWPNVQLAEE